MVVAGVWEGKTIDVCVGNEKSRLNPEKFVELQVSSSLKDRKVEKREGSQELRRLTGVGVGGQLIGGPREKGAADLQALGGTEGNIRTRALQEDQRVRSIVGETWMGGVSGRGRFQGRGCGPEAWEWDQVNWEELVGCKETGEGE